MIYKSAWLLMPLLAAFLLAGCAFLHSGFLRPYTASADMPYIDEDILFEPGPSAPIRIVNGGARIEINQERKLKVAVYLPEDSDYELVWAANDTKIVSVEQDGTIKGLSPGLAAITAALFIDGIEAFYSRVNIKVLPEGAPPDIIDPFSLFNELRGRRIITGGWADYANDGQGIMYASPAYPIIINDVLYPDPIAKFEAFIDALNRNNQHVFIIICGDIDLSRGRMTDEPGRVRGITDVAPYGASSPFVRRFDIRSDNTTIIGINDARIMYGGLYIYGRQNIIIRNLTFWDARDTRRNPGLDHLRISGSRTKGIWIDHARFTSGASNHRDGGDWHDTLLAIPGGEVTVSWCEFTNAREVMLVGGSDSGEFPAGATEDELLRLRSRRRVTLHHNYFHTARDRMPRTRGVQMHIYNNYFHNIWWHAMGPGLNAHFVVENNLFSSIRMNWAVYWGFRRNGAIVWHSGNAGVPLSSRWSSPATLATNPAPKPWLPSNFYAYTLDDDVQSLRTIIPLRAGPTLGTIEDFLAHGMRN